MNENTYIKSPLNYVGGKHKLLPQILPLFPSNINKFVDLFCGGGNVSANVKAEKIIANDIDDRVVGIFQKLQAMEIDEVIGYIEARIEEYGLNMTDPEPFNKFRKDYNESGDKNPLDLFLLICYSFNHQIRFNGKGEYNMPFGKERSQYNTMIKKNLISFHSAVKDITFVSKDFRTLKLDKLSNDDFVYCDPPYFLTCASYNENGGWTEKDTRDLTDLLDQLNERKIKFAMSEVFFNKGKENAVLMKWAESKGYNVHHLDYTYSNCNYHALDKTSKSDEVLITNY